MIIKLTICQIVTEIVSLPPFSNLRSIDFSHFFVNFRKVPFTIYQSGYITLNTKQINFEFGLRKESEHV